jgi:hypothetical protein
LEFRSYRAGQIDQAKNERFRGLALVKSRRSEPSNDTPRSESIFSESETRHNFAIWALEKDAVLGRRLHLYYCVRCKWAFRVEDRRALVTPLDANGAPIQGIEAGERLATFGLGPCPAYNGFLRNSRRTQKVTDTATFHAPIVALFCSVRRAWELVAMQWRRLDVPRRGRKQLRRRR